MVMHAMSLCLKNRVNERSSRNRSSDVNCASALFPYMPILYLTETHLISLVVLRFEHHYSQPDWLPYPDYKVDVVVFNHRQPPKESFDSVTIHAHSFYKHPDAFRLARYRDEVLRNFHRLDRPPYFAFHHFTLPLLWKSIVVGAAAVVRRVRARLNPQNAQDRIVFDRSSQIPNSGNY